MSAYKAAFIISFLLLEISSYGQFHFEKGYVINNQGERIECLIRNQDWKDNPLKIQYKLSENSEIVKSEVDLIKELGIGDQVLYQRYSVRIDRSSDDLNDLSNEKVPVFREELLFLKVIVDGKASLYHFRDGNLKRFFYSVDGSSVSQLVYKKYMSSQRIISENKYYTTQLWEGLRSVKLNALRVSNADYKLEDLKELFVAYNSSYNQPYRIYVQSKKEHLFNLNIRVGANLMAISATKPYLRTENIYFNKKLAGSIGLELESILSFNQNKWSLLLEPTFHKYDQINESENSQINRLSIEIPAGVRYYFFLNDRSKFFLNLGLAGEVDLDSQLVLDGSPELDVSSRMHMFFGAGYKLHDKLSIELRTRTAQELLREYGQLSSISFRNSMVIGYTLF